MGRWLNLRGDFLFDKRKMESGIRDAKKAFPDCPFLNIEKAKLFISWWPTIINPNEDSRVSIYPPVMGRLDKEIIEIGMSLQGPPPTAYGEEYPVFTDTNFFLELINNIYGNETRENIKQSLKKSYEEICWESYAYFD